MLPAINTRGKRKIGSGGRRGKRGIHHPGEKKARWLSFRSLGERKEAKILSVAKEWGFVGRGGEGFLRRGGDAPY